jgi:hypothetical protein
MSLSTTATSRCPPARCQDSSLAPTNPGRVREPSTLSSERFSERTADVIESHRTCSGVAISSALSLLASESSSESFAWQGMS